MSSLTGRKPKDTYPWLLQVGAGGPLSGTPRTICLGDGTATPLTITSTGLQVGGSAVVLSSGPQSMSGQLELTGQAATNDTSAMTRLLTRQDNLNAMAVVLRSDHAVYVANGGTASQSDGDNLASSTAANNRPLAYRYRCMSGNVASGVANSALPATTASMGVIYHPGSQNAGGRMRFGVGMLHNTSIPAGNANALGASDNGWGWEVYWDGAAIVFGLFRNDGSGYLTTDGASGRPAAVATGLTGAYNQYFNVKLDLASNGTVRAYAAFGTLAQVRNLPTSPTLTLPGGPTSGSYNANSSVVWALCNHSTNVAAVQMFAKVLDRIMILT